LRKIDERVSSISVENRSKESGGEEVGHGFMGITRVSLPET